MNKTKDSVADHSYYLYKDSFLARGNFSEGFEWFINGQWTDDRVLSLGLRDSMMDYGDASSFDYIHISEEWAEKLIQNGTAILEGQVSGSEKLHKPLVVNLKNWKKPIGIE